MKSLILIQLFLLSFNTLIAQSSTFLSFEINELTFDNEWTQKKVYIIEGESIPKYPKKGIKFSIREKIFLEIGEQLNDSTFVLLAGEFGDNSNFKKRGMYIREYINSEDCLVSSSNKFN